MYQLRIIFILIILPHNYARHGEASCGAADGHVGGEALGFLESEGVAAVQGWVVFVRARSGAATGGREESC